MARDFTDAELRQVAEFVARRYLEVERGLRGKECLRLFLTPQAYSQQYAAAASRYGKGGVVRQTDVGRISLQRPAPDVAFVTMPALQEGDRWGALVMELRADKAGHWRVTELTRAQDRNLVRQRPVPDRTPRVDPAVELARLSRDLQAAHLAFLATTQRRDRAHRLLADLAPEKPARDLQVGDVINTGRTPAQHWVEVRSVRVDGAAGQVSLTTPDGTDLQTPDDRPIPVLAVRGMSLADTRDAAAAAAHEHATTAHEAARWQRQVDQLELQRDELAHRAQSRAGLLVEGPPPDMPPAYVVRLLGEQPRSDDARDVWNEAAGAIDRYRHRWGIDSTDTALGPEPGSAEQREDRAATVERLRQLTARLDRLTAERDDLDAAGPPLGHTPELSAPFVLAAER